jgi:hypothetical protein
MYHKVLFIILIAKSQMMLEMAASSVKEIIYVYLAVMHPIMKEAK